MARIRRKKKSKTGRYDIMALNAVVSEEFLQSIKPFYDRSKLKIPYIQILFDWCIEYHKRTDEAPKEWILTKFKQEEEHLDEDIAENMEIFIERLTDELDRLENWSWKRGWLIAEDFFRREAAQGLLDNLQTLLEDGATPDDLDEVITSYRRIQTQKWDAEDVWNPDLIEAAWSETVNKPILNLRGGLGKKMNYMFARSNFVGLTGVEKRGKSWWLLEVAARAWYNKQNTIFISISDMSENQVRKRIIQRKMGIPLETCTVPIPELSCQTQIDNTCELTIQRGRGCLACLSRGLPEFEPNVTYMDEVRKTLSPEQVKAKAKKILKKSQKRFRMKAVTNFTVTDLKNMLDQFEEEDGWVPDCVVIDYADELSPDTHQRSKDKRHVIDEQWRELRAIGLERDCLMVTATQAAASAYEKSHIGMGDFSESKNKLAHVTHFVALNQTPEEKQEQKMRITPILSRDKDTNGEVTVLQCLPIGKININSYHTPKEDHDDYSD